MLKSLLTVLFLSVGLAQHPAVAGAQTPETIATQTPAASTPPPSPPLAAPTGIAPQLPERTISDDSSVSATISQDADQDSASSSGDTPISTLVELQSEASIVNGELVSDTKVSRLVSLLSATSGTFSFTKVPPGDYVLWVWAYGFVGVNTAPTNAGLFLANISVASSGKVTGQIPTEFLLKRKPEGVLGYPVRTGEEDGSPIPLGSVNVGSILLASPFTALPPTGEASTRSAAWFTLAGTLLLAVGAVGMTALGWRRRARAGRE